MKNSGIPILIITSIILIITVVFSGLDLPFGWVFYSMVLGQAALVVSVYIVLKDEYHTNKTFKDFYEDKPIAD